MPQATEDLIPQFAFLYTEIPADADNVVDLIRPVYVRTNKTELSPPPVTRLVVGLPMASAAICSSCKAICISGSFISSRTVI